MSDELTDDLIEEVADALASGSKIQAIKLYREATGKGLANAKQFIDALIPMLKEQDPERFQHLSDKASGCASVLLVAMGLVAPTLAWLLR